MINRCVQGQLYTILDDYIHRDVLLVFQSKFSQLFAFTKCADDVIPSSGLDLLDNGSDGLCPLASWTESLGAGLKTVSASDAVAILP